MGQGLFYSGILNDKGFTFSFVYDCGSVSNRLFLNREIDEFKTFLSKGEKKDKVLDLLVISHFHADHLNGLRRLLEGVEVNTVIIPYYDNDLLLCAWAESDDPDLREFYRNPVSWLLNQGVRRIVILDGSDVYYGRNEEPTLSDLQGQNENQGVMIHSGMLDHNVMWSAEGKSNANGASPIVVWKFKFENLSCKTERQEKYRKTIVDFTGGNALNGIETLESAQNEIKKRFGNKKLNINRSSIMMRHFPAEPDKPFRNAILNIGLAGLDPACIICDYGSEKYFSYWECYPHTLLTGDTEIKCGDSPKLFESDKKDFLILQYPHHGARNDDVCRLISKRPTYILPVISCGIKNSHGHPNYYTIKKLSLPLRPYFGGSILVNERQSFDYVIVAEY